LTSKFDLVPPEFLVIPPRVEDRSNEDSGEGGEGQVRMPRLLGPNPDQRAEGQREIERHQERPPRDGGVGHEWARHEDLSMKNPPGLQQTGNNAEADGSRRFGRQRTDTMVFNDTFTISEELAKGMEDYGPDSSGLSHEERDGFIDGSRYFEPVLPIQMPPPATVEDMDHSLEALTSPSHDEEEVDDTDKLHMDSHDEYLNSERPPSPSFDAVHHDSPLQQEAHVTMCVKE